MRNERGFTLIELLLVVMIIGFMLAIILPRGLRATTDAKYNLVRQNASELAGFANDWIEQQILAQDEASTATRAAYLDTLVNSDAATAAAWVADKVNNSNWNNQDPADNADQIVVIGRFVNDDPSDGTTSLVPENTVEEIIEPAKIPVNPFNGASVFLSPNDPDEDDAVVPGALACTFAQDISTGGTFDYYSLIFQGTDSLDSGGYVAEGADYHAGMADGSAVTGLTGVREGVFFTKVRQ